MLRLASSNLDVDYFQSITAIWYITGQIDESLQEQKGNYPPFDTHLYARIA